MMDQPLSKLVELLDIENLDENFFRGTSPSGSGARVFGGQVVAQALVAASRTIDSGLVHSLHAYFLRPGDPSIPILYQVERSRNGRSFSARVVHAIQRGAPILTMLASFQQPEPGVEFQVPMPQVPDPESLTPLSEQRREWLARYGDQLSEALRRNLSGSLPFDIRECQDDDPVKMRQPGPPHHAYWFRSDKPLPDDPIVQRCALAYASDYSLLLPALRPFGRHFTDEDLVVASIDHAIWFHRPPRCNDWLLYVTHATSVQSARGMCHGQFFDRNGVLIATTAQECLMREVSRGA
jgi:acyl-CoA thioesterase-2